MKEALEEFFAGELHQVLSSFVRDNRRLFTPPDSESGHSHANHELFQKYTALVETKLAIALERRGMTSDELWEGVQELHAAGEQVWAPGHYVADPSPQPQA